MRLGRDRMRRIVAGLLALTLLVLPGLPMRHAAAAAPLDVGAAHHCATEDASAAVGHEAVAHRPPATHDPGRTQDRDPADMACCPAAQCPATIAVPPTVLPSPLPSPAVSIRAIPADHQLTGIPVDPALRPPRRGVA